ncbi:DUF5641 domain-containing protein [Trichonephila clavipes]|nr:DUF5641 domain-containing protein [Trichonephila clavipes]
MKNAVSGRTKTDLSALYDELEGKLRSLESLGRTQEKYGDFLTPLVESCLPEEILMAWERKRNTETDLRKRMKYRIKLLSDLRQRFRKEYLSELIQKQNDNRVREPRIGEMLLIGNDNKKRLSWPIAKIIELIPGRDGEIRTVRLKTQHGTVIRPVQRIFPLEVQAIANSDMELKEESVSVKSTKPEKVLNINDAIIKKNILLLEDWLKNRRDLIF